MFVVQVDFCDGISQPEAVFIRRLFARIGTRETSHLILDGVAKLNYELAIYRGIGGKFYCKAIPIGSEMLPHFPWEKEYEGLAEIKIGPVIVNIVVVPAEKAQRYLSDETFDLLQELKDIGIRDREVYPALFSISEPQVAISLSGVKDFFIGKSRKCLFRADKFLSNSEYALVRIKEEGVFEIRDLDAQEGTCVNGINVSRPKILEPKDRISFSTGVELVYLNSPKDLMDLSEELPEVFMASGTASKRNLRTISGPVKPNLLPVHIGQTISIGRDATHNVWIDAPFISRLHCSIYVEKEGYSITDFSTNGVAIEGRKIGKGNTEFFPLGKILISFGHGTSMCLSELDDSGFKEFLFNSEMNPKEYSHDRGVVPEPIVPGPELEEPVIERKEDLVIVNQTLDRQPLDRLVENIEVKNDRAVEEPSVNFSSFEEYQKRSIRLMEESGANFLSSTEISFDEINNREFPVRIGLSRFLPQVFIGLLILIILVFFVVLGLNLIH